MVYSSTHRIKIIGLALVIMAGQWACQKKTTKTARTDDPKAAAPADAGGSSSCQDAAAPAPLGLFEERKKLDPSLLRASISDASEQTLNLTEGGVYHTLLLNFSATLSDGSAVRPDGYWLDVCKRDGSSCLSGFTSSTKLVRVLPDSTVQVKVRACARVNGASKKGENKSFCGQNYACESTGVKATYQVGENSGNFRSYLEKMVAQEKAENDFTCTGFKLYQHIVEFYPVTPEQAKGKTGGVVLSEFDKAMWNNAAMGPALFTNWVETSAQGIKESLVEQSSKKLSSLSLTEGGTPCANASASASGQTPASGGSDQSLDDILKNLAGGEDTSSQTAGPRAGTGSTSSSTSASTGSTGSSDSVTSDDATTTTVEGQPVASSSGDSFKNKRNLLIGGAAMFLVGAVAYKTAGSALDKLDEAEKKVDEEKKDKTETESAQDPEKVEPNLSSEATAARKLANELKVKNTVLESESSGADDNRKKEINDEIEENKRKIAEIDKKYRSQDIDGQPASTGRSVTGSDSGNKSTVSSTNNAGGKSTASSANSKASSKVDSSNGTPSLLESINQKLSSKEGLNVRKKAGVGLMGVGAALAVYSVAFMPLTSIMAKPNVFKDDKFLDLANKALDTLDYKALLVLDSALDVQGEAKVRSLGTGK